MLTKVYVVKGMVFPVVMYGCESWIIKKARCWRIDAFELWCWRRLLRVPWTARRSNQSIVKEINSEYSLEGLILKHQYLATWCEEPTHWKRFWCWEWEQEGPTRQTDRQTEDEMARWYHRLNGHEFEKTLGDSEGQRSLACCRPWVAKSQTWLNNWTTTTGLNKKSIIHLLFKDGETEYRDIERLVQSGDGVKIPIQAVWSQSPGS